MIITEPFLCDLINVGLHSTQPSIHLLLIRTLNFSSGNKIFSFSQYIKFETFMHLIEP